MSFYVGLTGGARILASSLFFAEFKGAFAVLRECNFEYDAVERRKLEIKMHKLKGLNRMNIFINSKMLLKDNFIRLHFFLVNLEEGSKQN